MNLVQQLEGLLNYSQGLKQTTIDSALKETIDYYLEWQQQTLKLAQEHYKKGIVSKHS